MEFFDPTKPFYKGNLHTHTTRSDGTYSPEQCIAAYREAGYDFLSITDHRVFYPTEVREDFLVLSGTEFHHHDLNTRRAFHIVGLHLREPVESDDSTLPQELIHRIHAAGGIAVLAHPMWSLLTHDDLMDLWGYDHLEVYNTLSEAYSCHGFSECYADVLLSKGYPKKLLAVDDCHFYDRDLFGGWIMLQCPQLTAQGVIDALLTGSYYSSTGPELRRLVLVDGQVQVECSPAQSVAFVTDAFFEPKRIVYAADAPLCSATYRPGSLDRYVRVEVRDAAGAKAWSNWIDLSAGAIA